MSVLSVPPAGASAANSGSGSSPDATGQDTPPSTMPAESEDGETLQAVDAANGASLAGIRARIRRSTVRPRSAIQHWYQGPDQPSLIPIQNSPGPASVDHGAFAAGLGSSSGSHHHRLQQQQQQQQRQHPPPRPSSFSTRINRISWPNPLDFASSAPDIASTTSPAAAYSTLDFSSYASFVSTWTRANPDLNPSGSLSTSTGTSTTGSSRSRREPRHSIPSSHSPPQPMLFTHSASFSSPAPPAGLSATTSSTTTTTQTTPAGTSPPNESASRRGLRRLSHLRSYNPSHLLSRDSHNSPSNCEGITRSASDFNNLAAVPRSPQHVAGTTSRAGNRLTLVDSVPVPSRATATNNNIADRTNGRTQNAANNTQISTPQNARGQSSTSPTASSPNPESPEESVQPRATPQPSPRLETESNTHTQPQPEPAMARTRSSTTGDVAGVGAAATTAATAADFLPSIRLTAHYDPRSTRPSLTFPAISRTLPTGTESIRVGRYSERDSQNIANVPGNQPSSAPIGFKSKVVSRRHCEFWYENGKWYIKDVKSSSGTFLNHIRLSPPSQESKAFVVGDGDIVQLGIDFKGGEEMIFRCVKMRVELNRGWQNKLNTFNMAAHKRLQTMAKTTGTPAEKAGSSSQDCSICLNMIAPCQSLFVAPCSHTWHFKCVRSLLTSPQYPIFICPNCRAGCDLEADVDDPAEDWEQLDADGEIADRTSVNGAPLANALTELSIAADGDAMDTTMALGASDGPGNLPHATSEPLPIRNPAPGTRHTSDVHRVTPSPPHANEGPITPRNEVGPWVFDGGAGQRARDQDGGVASLDAAAEEMTVRANGANGGSAHLPSDSSEGSIR